MAEAKAKAQAKADDHYKQHPEDAEHDAQMAMYMVKAVDVLAISTSEPLKGKDVIAMAQRLKEIDYLNNKTTGEELLETKDITDVEEEWEPQEDELSSIRHGRNQYAKYIKTEKDSVKK